MVLEHAQLTVDPAQAGAFEAAFAEARALPAAVDGFVDLAIWRSLEQPGVYRLLIRWDSVAAHMEGFRQSPGFTRWRELLSPFYSAPTEVDHLELLGG